mmetsp:Transcript_12467/g.18387  ORF Transcript_12467/g.18387 Transcript_12467/m.18387 type:complete len:277 (-) Transcript_12467:242-1072(-)
MQFKFKFKFKCRAEASIVTTAQPTALPTSQPPGSKSQPLDARRAASAGSFLRVLLVAGLCLGHDGQPREQAGRRDVLLVLGRHVDLAVVQDAEELDVEGLVHKRHHRQEGAVFRLVEQGDCDHKPDEVQDDGAESESGEQRASERGPASLVGLALGAPCDTLEQGVESHGIFRNQHLRSHRNVLQHVGPPEPPPEEVREVQPDPGQGMGSPTPGKEHPQAHHPFPEEQSEELLAQQQQAVVRSGDEQHGLRHQLGAARAQDLVQLLKAVVASDFSA